MTAFVLGATGLVGREVVRQLGARGARPHAHVRPDSRDLERWRAELTTMGAEIDTTPWDTGALATRFRALSPAQLYIVIGTTRARAKRDSVDGDIYERIDYGLTKLAVDAAVGGGRSPRLVYLSSVGADASSTSAYLRARGKAEAAVIASGLPWMIARPSFILGDRDDRRPGEKIGAAAADGLLRVAGLFGAKTVRERYRSTHADVLASALIRLGEAPRHDRIVDGADLR